MQRLDNGREVFRLRCPPRPPSWRHRTYHLRRQHADIDLVVYATVSLEDEVPRSLHELVGAVAQEEVTRQHLSKAWVTPSASREECTAKRTQSFMGKLLWQPWPISTSNLPAMDIDAAETRSCSRNISPQKTGDEMTTLSSQLNVKSCQTLCSSSFTTLHSTSNRSKTDLRCD